MSKTAKALVTIITDGGKLSTLIKSIATRGAKLDADIHQAALSCIHQAEEFRNATPMMDLLAAMPKSSRKNALIEWALAFGKFEYSAEGKALTYAAGKTTDMEQAQAKPFWEFKPEPDFKVMDFHAEFAKLLKRAEAAVASGDERHKVTTEDLAKVRKAMSELGLTALQ